MKRIEAVYLVFKDISPYLKDKYSAEARLLIADFIVRMADHFDQHSHTTQDPEDESNYLSQNVADAFENPFEILEFGYKYMGLHENNE